MYIQAIQPIKNNLKFSGSPEKNSSPQPACHTHVCQPVAPLSIPPLPVFVHVPYHENRSDKKNINHASDIIIDTLTTASAFWTYKNIDKFTPVTELFKKGLGNKTRAVAISLAIATGAIVNPTLSICKNLIFKKEKSCSPQPACHTHVCQPVASPSNTSLKSFSKNNSLNCFSQQSAHAPYHETFSDKEKFNPLKQIAIGAINGATAPLLAFSSLWLTVPATYSINSATRFFTDKNIKDKSLKNFTKIQKENIGTTALFAMPTLAFIGSRGKHSLNSWEIACKKAKENNEKLRAFRNPYEKNLDLEKITRTLDEKTKAELGNKIIPIFFKPSENAIIDTNIFIAKWLQTIPDKQIDNIQDIHGVQISEALKKVVKNLKGACPASYTPNEAQSIITRTFGGKYTITQNEPLGVGTIAETYLAKDTETGKEVVIKFLKKGISKEKIEADKEQALTLLENSPLKNKPEEYEYYKKYLTVLYDAWSKETNLTLEKEAAEIMAQNAKKFNVVKPIEIKDNVYVMEKAKGVQLNKLGEELKRRGTKLSEADIKKLLLNYNEVFIEQLISIPRDSKKIIQADPNSANIFIDLDNLEKPITFLDLGNVLRYNNKTATSNALGHLDYIFGNSKGIAKTNLDGAILPQGMTKDEAIEKLTEELNTHIFNNETLIPPPNTINDFCTSAMREMKIIPNADNANLIKAETTYFANIFELRHKIQEGLSEEISHDAHFASKLKLMLKEMKESGDFQTLVRCILKEIFTSVKNANFKTQKHAYLELKDKINYIETNKEQALTTFYGLIN